MKLSTILIGLFFSFLYSQNEQTQTKMEQVISNTGKIIKLENFEIPRLDIKNEKLKVNVRRVTISDEIFYFLLLEYENENSKKYSAIAEDDIMRVMDAIDELIEHEQNDSSNANWLENKYVTDDGFKVGYSKGGFFKMWFIVLEKYGDSIIYFGNPEVIKSIFIKAQIKIDALKTDS